MNTLTTIFTHTRIVLGLGIALGTTALPTVALANDPGKAACLTDAKRLCPEAVHALSRSRVQACLIQNIDKTSAFCHTTMLKLKAEHLAAAKDKN